MNFRSNSSNTRDEHSPHSLMYEEEIRDWEEEIREWDEEQALLMHLYSSNNSLIASCIDEDEQPLHIGSIHGHIAINFGREVGHVRLWNDYFSSNPTYGEDLFVGVFECVEIYFFISLMQSKIIIIFSYKKKKKKKLHR